MILIKDLNKKCIAKINGKEVVATIQDITADLKTVMVETSEDFYNLENDQVKLIPKFTTKIEYIVNREEDRFDDYKEKITSREFSINIKSNSTENAELIMSSLEQYITNRYSEYYSFHNCYSIEEYEGVYEIDNSITIGDKSEYEEIKELYKDWKKEVKA